MMKLSTISIFCCAHLLSTLAFGQVSCEELKELVRKDMAIWNDRTPEKVVDVYHVNCRDEEYYQGLQEKIATVQKNLDENPRLQIEVADLICGENVVTVHYRATGYSQKYQLDFETEGMYTAHIKDGKFHTMRGHTEVLRPLLNAGYRLQPPGDDASKLVELVKIEEEIWNTGNLNLCDKIYTEDYKEYLEGKLSHEGIAGRKESIRSVLEDNEDFSVSYQQIIPAENTVTIQWEARGYNKKYEIDFVLQGISINHIKDGKIVRSEGVRDMLGALLGGGYSLSPPNK